MREIKFEIMFEVTNRDFTKSIKKHYTSLDRLVNGSDNMNYADIDVVAKRQYIGLKDVNGTQIYEGDIVHWGHVKGAKECAPRKAVVEIAPDIQFKTFNLGKNNHTFKFGRFIYTNTSKALEIIGNIHENPDLLEQQ